MVLDSQVGRDGHSKNLYSQCQSRLDSGDAEGLRERQRGDRREWQGAQCWMRSRGVAAWQCRRRCERGVRTGRRRSPDRPLRGW